jgi:hypothetical protein
MGQTQLVVVVVVVVMNKEKDELRLSKDPVVVEQVSRGLCTFTS